MHIPETTRLNVTENKAKKWRNTDIHVNMLHALTGLFVALVPTVIVPIVDVTQPNAPAVGAREFAIRVGA